MKLLKKKPKIILLTIICCLGSIAWLDPFKDKVDEANKLYQKKEFAAAYKVYQDAEEYAPNDKAKLKLAYNKGNALYMQGDYQQAIAAYQNSLQSEDSDVQKKAFFNMANSYLKEQKYEDAVESYISALKIDPNYKKAKENLEYLLTQKTDQNKDQKKDQKKNNQQNKKQQQQNSQQQNQQNSQQNKNLSKEQIESILNSMNNKPVRRQKGSGNARNLQKGW